MNDQMKVAVAGAVVGVILGVVFCAGLIVGGRYQARGTIVCKVSGYADLANITMSGTLVTDDLRDLANRISGAVCEGTRA